MPYPKHEAAAGVPASPDLPDVERRVLEHWTADKTFEASVESRDAGVGCRTTATC
jgi:isoleucyl-tRNA synthetase